MSLTKTTAAKTIDIVKNLPRITLANLRPNPGAKKDVSSFIFEKLQCR